MHFTVPQSLSMAKLERDLALPVGFIGRLLTEGEDWEFLVKLHAFAEAALTSVLERKIAALPDDEKRQDMQKLCDGQTSLTKKLKVAFVFHMLRKELYTVLASMAALRNRCIQSTAGVSCSFRLREPFAEETKAVEQAVNAYLEQNKDRIEEQTFFTESIISGLKKETHLRYCLWSIALLWVLSLNAGQAAPPEAGR